MSNQATHILEHLKTVQRERVRRLATPGLSVKVLAIKAYQQRRFAHTYADLLHSVRYGPASRFFLDELYGPTDFSQRDAQFTRAVPALVKLFPSEVVDTVAVLAELHALSETLDSAMGKQLRTPDVNKLSYVRAWLATGQRADRSAQVSLTLDVAARLDRLTRRALMRNSLRLMRAPARAAGLTQLQTFLETGFETFRAMNGVDEFITTVDVRERALASALFAAELDIAAEESSLTLAEASLP